MIRSLSKRHRTFLEGNLLKRGGGKGLSPTGTARRPDTTALGKNPPHDPCHLSSSSIALLKLGTGSARGHSVGLPPRVLCVLFRRSFPSLTEDWFAVVGFSR